MAGTLIEAYGEMLEKLEDTPMTLLGKLLPLYSDKHGAARLAREVGVDPRTVNRWFNKYKATGKESRGPDKKLLPRLAGQVPVKGGRFEGGACVSYDCRNDRTMTLPRVTNQQAMQQLNAALRSGDEASARAAYWRAYGVTPDDTWDEDFTLSADARR